MDDLWIAIVLGWFACGILGAVVAGAKGGAEIGCLLGALFGPLGVIAAFAVDCRAKCPDCQTRLNGEPKICPQCRRELHWNAEQPLTAEQAEIEARRRQQREAEWERQRTAQEAADAARRVESQRRHQARMRVLAAMPGKFHAAIGGLVGPENQIIARFVEAAIAAAVIGGAVLLWLL